MKRPIFTFLFILILGLSILAGPVFGKQPTPQVGTFDEGLEIRTPTVSSVKINPGLLTANIHVFNITNGMPIVDGIVCYLHLYNENGTHIFESESSVTDHTFDFEFKINNANFSEVAERSFIIQCNNSEVGGFSSSSFRVTESGTDEDSSYFLLLLILIPAFICVLFFGGSVVLDEEHSVFKIGLLLLSLMFVFPIFWVAGIVVGLQFHNYTELIDALGLLTWLFGMVDAVIMAYFIIYALKKIFDFVGMDKEKDDIKY